MFCLGILGACWSKDCEIVQTLQNSSLCHCSFIFIVMAIEYSTLTQNVPILDVDIRYVIVLG